MLELGITFKHLEQNIDHLVRNFPKLCEKFTKIRIECGISDFLLSGKHVNERL